MDLKEIIILICWKIHDTIEIGDFMKLELLTYEKENLPRGWKPYYIYLIIQSKIEPWLAGGFIIDYFFRVSF